ncbi:MAG: hypothetical protein CEO22_616 [Candidatus Berkelbacteria bacterium Gr01-1014_85]|uniref:Uncharacterized protein n=1 Tax=Candidatus Berkelbacteria bacterium Gr01-1014_85 TaxID=2017150 RepID=A0A554J9M7_9BACT|nr:MAG: hypothetical protein CEO22_616 [Candidatus Berkelbacteria bacterium Gr01-1014_85]
MYKTHFHLSIWLGVVASLMALVSPIMASAHVEQPAIQPVIQPEASASLTDSALPGAEITTEPGQNQTPWLTHERVHYLQLLLIVGGLVAVIWRVRQVESLRRQGLLKN